jgi:hypothetical protein
VAGSGPGRRVRAVALWHEREGGGAGLTRHEQLIGGTGLQRGPVASGGVQEGEEEARQRRHRALTGGASQHSVARGLTRFKLKSEFKRFQI